MMSFTNDNNAVEEEVRYDPEYGPFPFFKSMEQAEKNGIKEGYEFNIGEMPLGALMHYNNTTYLLLKFDSLPNEMICKNAHTGKIERVDGTDSAIYIGREPTRRRSYRDVLQMRRSV